MGKLGQWLQVGANIGFLAGLILVGFQMRQNADLLELQLMQQNADQFQSVMWSIAGEDYADTWEKHILDPKSLTLGDMRTVNASYSGAIDRWIGLYRLNQRGLVDAGDWKETVRSNGPSIFSNTYGRSWLQEVNKSGWIPAELKAEIDSVVADDTRRGLQDFFRDVQENIQE